MHAQSHVTQLIEATGRGDPGAASALLPLVYDELRVLARSQLGAKAACNTLQPTALVHEAFLKLVGNLDPGWNGRGHFFGAAANAMRQILVDQARRKKAVKHGGGRARVEFGATESVADADLMGEDQDLDLLVLDQALRELERTDPRKGRIVMLRYFAGLTAEQTAQALGVSTPTIDREWRFIRAYLHRYLRRAGVDAAAGVNAELAA
ncbi:MAG: ECF-type sigma factor [Phycisphaerales bacterium]